MWVDDEPRADTSSQHGVYARDKDDEGKVYWFPSIMEKSKSAEAEDLAILGK